MEPVIHYSVTPELFNSHLIENPQKVKSLFIDYDPKVMPQIVYDTPNGVLQTVFKDEKTFTLFFEDGYHMYLSPLEQYIGKYPNPIATYLLRKNNMVNYGSLHPDVVCGHVVIFGSVNLKTQQIDNKNYSAPYQLVEESLRIYNIERLY